MKLLWIILGSVAFGLNLVGAAINGGASLGFWHIDPPSQLVVAMLELTLALFFAGSVRDKVEDRT